MKRSLAILIPLAVLMTGCSHEEPAEPLSPQAQEALKTGHTGPPPEAKLSGPGVGAATRGADAKKPTGK